jgi:uroporphyrinogen decarboxylase
MRQAGRYLPEYRAIRKEAGSFLKMCKTPDIACEITLQPIQRFPLDAAIIYSDILTIPDAMGCGLYFVENEGPRFEKKILTAQDVNTLLMPDPENELRYVMDAIRLVKRELDQKVPLIGFAGSPWTIACYMVEGSSSKDFQQIKKMLYNDPVLLHTLLEKLSLSIIEYLKAQIQAGVDVLMLFDTWGGILSPEAYRTFSLHYMKKIIAQLPPHIPCILFSKGASHALLDIQKSGCTAIGLDWTMDIQQARAMVDKNIALQGNLDPAIMLTSPAVIEQEVKKIIEAYGHQPGHIFNLGHGITPQVPPEHVAALVESVHNLTHYDNTKPF